MRGEKRIQIQMANRSHLLTCLPLPVPCDFCFRVDDGAREVLLLVLKPWVDLQECGWFYVGPLTHVDPPEESDHGLGKDDGPRHLLLAFR